MLFFMLFCVLLQVPGVLVLDVTSPDLPTARLEHKAHLTLNAFDNMVLQEVRGQQVLGSWRRLLLCVCPCSAYQR